MPLPQDYLAALQNLALACMSYRDATGAEVVLVGGEATAIYTAGKFLSGDFDVVASYKCPAGSLTDDRIGDAW